MQIIKKLSLFLLSVSLFLSPDLTAQDATSNIPFDASIQTGRLKNGIKYYIKKNARPEKKIELRLVVNAGSIQEDDDQQGLAHFMEHMNFNGLEHFPHNEIVSYLQSIGVEFGADLNAYTSFDQTVYILPVPADDKDKVEKAFTILADWSGGALLDGEEIDKERGVVLEESRLRKGANDRMMQKWLPKLMNGSRYARRLPIGKDDILENFDHSVLKRFYKDWYRPDLQAVIVVGDIEVAEAERLIIEKFGRFQNPANEKKRPQRYEVPARTKSEAMVLSDKENQYTMIRIMGSSHEEDASVTMGDYRSDLIHSLFNRMLSSRYDELKNSSQPPFIFGSSSYGGSWTRGYANFSAFGVCGVEQSEQAAKALMREAMRAKKFGFTSSELERAKASILSFYEKSYNERDKMESGNYVNELINHFLEQEPVPGIEWEFNYTKSAMAGIQLEEVNQFARQLDLDKNFFALLTTKPADHLPTDEQLLHWVNEVINEKLEPYKEEKVSDKLLAVDPRPGKVIEVSKNEKLGTTTWTLDNGAVVTIKPTDFKNDEILLQASRPGGYSLYDMPDYQSAQYCNNVIDEMGFGEFSNTALDKFMSGKRADVGVMELTYSDMIRGSSTVKDLETMFQLLHLKCTLPRADGTAFGSYVNREKQSAESSLASPRTAFFNALNLELNQNHPRARSVPYPDDFDKIDMNHAMEYYYDRFHTANGMHYFIVGNVDPETLKPLVEKYIGGLSGDKIKSRYKDLGITKKEGKTNFVYEKGSEAQSMIMDMMYGPARYDADENSELSILAQVIDNKITEILREKMSGIYGGGLSISLSKIPREEFIARSYLPCGPENVVKLRDAFWEIIESAKKPGGITEEDVKKAVEPSLQQYQVNIKKNGFWLNNLHSAYTNAYSPERILNYEERLKAITPEMLTALANKYLSSKNIFKATWMPETK